MSTRSSLLALFTLALACTSLEGRESSSDPPFAPPPPPLGGTSSAIDPQPSAPDVRVAISSVFVEADCPDAPASNPKPPAKRAPPASDVAPGAVAQKARWSCRQSSMQVAFDNVGKRDADVSIAAVRMIDAANDRSVATLIAREPTVWSDASGGYAAWGEHVTADTKIAASYELSAPDWGRVAGMIGGSDLATHPFVLEVEVAVAGVTTTVRSPEFTRPPVAPVPPT